MNEFLSKVLDKLIDFFSYYEPTYHNNNSENNELKK